MPQKNNSQQSKGLKQYQNDKRKETCARIDDTIHRMREEGATITKKSLAEELGLNERTLYSDYVKQHLLLFKEFNPALEEPVFLTQNAEELSVEIQNLKLINRELKVKNKELIQEIKAQKGAYTGLQQQYERLLGKYQIEVGSKVIPFKSH